MLEEVNQYRVDSKLKSYYKFEQEIAAAPDSNGALRSRSFENVPPRSKGD